MKKIFSITVIFLLPFIFGSLPFGKGCGCASAQSIDSAEYFFDIDPGVRNGNAVGFITPLDSIIDSVVISTVGLNPGFHNLFFRVRDTNGVWSLHEPAKFYLSDTVPHTIPSSYQIVSTEYFFDTDPGIGSGISLVLAPGDSILDTLSAATAGLTSGFHIIFYRVKDSNHVWSLYEGGRFYVSDTISHTVLPSYPIASAEYFYDSDPGIGNGIAIANFTTADSVILNISLPTAPLTAGMHNLFLRVRDSINVWSLYEGQSFSICNFVPVADFSADTVCLHSPTSFTDLSSNVDTSAHYTYGWDFNNDGLADDTTKGNVTHLFSTPGTHTVSLVVNNTSGCTSTVKKIIYVDSLPTVTFILPKDTICKTDTMGLSGGFPAGGVYSGSGVHEGFFYGDSVGAGNHFIAYTYYNLDSCFVTKYATITVNYCTGVNEFAGGNFPVRVSPNPFRTTTTLQIGNSKPTTNYELEIYNLIGEKLFVETSRIPIAMGTDGFIIRRGGLLQGIYFYKILLENKIAGSGKLVIID